MQPLYLKRVLPALMLVSLLLCSVHFVYKSLGSTRHLSGQAATLLRFGISAPVILFPSLLLFLAGVFSLLIGVRFRTQLNRIWLGWMLLGLLLAALATTKAFALHDYVIDAVRRIDARVGVPILIPGLALAFLFATFPISAMLLRSMERQVRRRFLLGAVLFLVGGIALEAASEHFWALYGPHVLVYTLTSALENLSEMLGASLGASALLLQLQHRRIRASDSSESDVEEFANR